MTTSDATAAISSAPSSTLSPHAAPFTLPVRPPGRRQDGDVSRSMDDSFVMYTHPVSSTVCIGMKSCDTVYPPSTHGMHTGQPSSWAGFCMDVYPSSTCSSSGMTSSYKQQNPLTSGNGSKCSTLKIESPPNKTSETNKNSCSLRSKLVITENPKSNKDTEKDTSVPRILQDINPVGGNGNSQGTMIRTKEANPVFIVKPLYIPTTCADPCGFVADDVKTDPSECSVDSPCYRGTLASRLSSFDVLQQSAPQSINQESEAFDPGQKQGSSTVRHYEAPAELQTLVTSKNKHNHSQSHVELGVSKKSGDICTNQTEDSHGKELECANQRASKCTSEQKHCLELRDNCMKRSGLNSSARILFPCQLGNQKLVKFFNRKEYTGILKAIENLTEVLWNSYSDDEILLEEHDYSLLESLIENLRTCLHKTRKGPIKGASGKAGLKAPHSQTTFLKSDAGKYNGSCIADGGKGITINGFAGSSHMPNDFGKNSLIRSQPSLNNVPMKISYEEEHSQVSDLGTNPSNLYGAALAHPPMLSFPKDHPTEEISGARTSQNILYPGDCIQSGGNGAPSCSSGNKGYTTLPKKLQGDHFLTGLEETFMHRRAHPGLQLAQNRAHRGLNTSTSDGASARSYITGTDGILHGNSEYGSSDREHVLKEEIGWS